MTIGLDTSARTLSTLLLGACFLIFIMIIIGGLTRLTGSGLSMVEWKPITGFLPPLSAQDWVALFESYQQSPEYLKINQGMRLEEFKNIFWLEYIHRLWGRLIGLYFLLLFWIALRHPILRRYYLGKLLGLWMLGAFQGVLGWYMVKSGLVDDPHVSPHRLAAHFMLAIVTYGLTFNMALKLRHKESSPSAPTSGWNHLIVLIGITLFYGVLVAGHHAGLIYNTFPLMNGHWMPEDLFFDQPWALNLVHNPATVQWLHRILATLTLVSVLGFALLKRSHENTKEQNRGLIAMAILVLLQFSLGIITLLFQVPLWSALLHQACAVLLLTSVLFTRDASRRALMPGSVLPSSHSRKAPPAVDK